MCEHRVVSEWVVLLHVAVAFWFVPAPLGRNITMAKARTRTPNLLIRSYPAPNGFSVPQFDQVMLRAYPIWTQPVLLRDRKKTDPVEPLPQPPRSSSRSRFTSACEPLRVGG